MLFQCSSLPPFSWNRFLDPEDMDFFCFVDCGNCVIILQSFLNPVFGIDLECVSLVQESVGEMAAAIADVQ